MTDALTDASADALTDAPPRRPPPPPILRLVGAMLWGYLVVYSVLLYFAPSRLIGLDPYFHARYSSLLPGRMFDRTLPQTAYSIWADRWGDKEFLFHVALMPFCQDERLIIPAMKFAGLLLVLGILVSFWYALRRMGIRGATWWTAALLCTSGVWWYRAGMLRGYLASLVLFPWIVLMFERRRARALAILTFVYAWSYTAPHFAFTIVLCLALGRWVVRRLRPDMAPSCEGARDRTLVLASGAATLAGLLIHPHTPNNVMTFLIHLGPVLMRAWRVGSGVRVGDEFESETFRFMLTVEAGMFVALGLAWVVAAFGRRRVGERSALLLFMTLPLFGLYGLSHRFLEYLVPMSVWALASVVTDQLAGRTWREAVPRPALLKAMLAATALAAIVLHAWVFLCTFGRLMSPYWDATHEGAVAWLKRHAAPGELIVPIDWAEFPELYFLAPEFRYVAGMEPKLMEVIHPQKLALLEAIRFRERDFDAAALADVAREFPEARWFLLWYPTAESQGRHYGEGNEGDGVVPEPLYRDDYTEIHDLRPHRPPPQ